MLQKFSTILLAALLLESCGTMTRSRTTSVSFASFQQYPNMWISPNACPMTHTAIGHLNIDVSPAIGTPTNKGDGIYSQSYNALQFERISYDELLEMAVVEARARGANGISNLSVTEDRKPGETFATGYHVSGLLIRVE